MIRPTPMTASDKAWQAQDDARTLQRAQEIVADKGRHTAAQTHAKQEIARLQKVVSKAPATKAVKVKGRR